MIIKKLRNNIELRWYEFPDSGLNLLAALWINTKKGLDMGGFMWYINYVVSLRILDYEWKQIIGDITDYYNGILCIWGRPQIN